MVLSGVVVCLWCLLCFNCLTLALLIVVVIAGFVICLFVWLGVVACVFVLFTGRVVLFVCALLVCRGSCFIVKFIDLLFGVDLLVLVFDGFVLDVCVGCLNLLDLFCFEVVVCLAI